MLICALFITILINIMSSPLGLCFILVQSILYNLILVSSHSLLMSHFGGTRRNRVNVIADRNLHLLCAQSIWLLFVDQQFISRFLG